MVEATEQIRITEQNWKRLNQLKNPGESFNDVIDRMYDTMLENGHIRKDAPQ